MYAYLYIHIFLLSIFVPSGHLIVCHLCVLEFNSHVNTKRKKEIPVVDTTMRSSSSTYDSAL